MPPSGLDRCKPPVRIRAISRKWNGSGKTPWISPMGAISCQQINCCVRPEGRIFLWEGNMGLVRKSAPEIDHTWEDNYTLIQGADPALFTPFFFTFASAEVKGHQWISHPWIDSFPRLLNSLSTSVLVVEKNSSRQTFVRHLNKVELCHTLGKVESNKLDLT